MYPVTRSLLFKLEPEQAHRLAISMMRLAGDLPPLSRLLRQMYTAPARPIEAFGLHFRNPIGLAAGYDKDGLGWRGLACLGFGHIEVGTVTPLPQAGNPKPRLFRLTEEQALINRLGFPGRGAEFVARRLKGKRPRGLVLGVNLGKNKDTRLEQAANDYLLLLEQFAPLADYLVVNVSSPNTVGLRRLQARDLLEGLLTQLAQSRAAKARQLGHHVPLLVKLAPDLQDNELDDALGAIISSGMDGVIATNTTISREGLHSQFAREAGGLSGAPLYGRSLAMVRRIVHLTEGRLPVVGVGGIMDADSARTMLEAGAVLVQVYTGLIYNGPALIKKISSELR